MLAQALWCRGPPMTALLPCPCPPSFWPRQVGLARALWALVVPLARIAVRLVVWCSPLLIWAGEPGGTGVWGACTACSIAGHRPLPAQLAHALRWQRWLCARPAAACRHGSALLPAHEQNCLPWAGPWTGPLLITPAEGPLIAPVVGLPDLCRHQVRAMVRMRRHRAGTLRCGAAPHCSVGRAQAGCTPLPLHVLALTKPARAAF